MNKEFVRTFSEISLKNRSDESGHALKFNDVSFENNDKTLCVKICSSKTDIICFNKSMDMGALIYRTAEGFSSSCLPTFY
jgi:hypothetical protein